MSKSICRHCKHKDGCDETVRLYGLPNMRVTECATYEPKDGDTKRTVIQNDTNKRRND